MKNSPKTTIALLMAAALCMSGCGGSKTSENGNTNNNQTTTAASKASEDVVKTEINNEFDIDAYIANYTPKTELTNKGTFDYEVKISGNVLSCPISAAELAALGYESKDSYTVVLKPNEVYTIGNKDSHYYSNKDGIAIIVDDLVTTANSEIEFNSSKPRNDVFFTYLNINKDEKFNQESNVTAEFYGGTIGTTTEAELVEKCGTFDGKKNSARWYYEYPDAENPDANQVGFYIDENTLQCIRFYRSPDKIPS